MNCPKCGYISELERCPLCGGEWEAWDLLLPPLPLPKNREQIASWIGQLPFPVAIDILATSSGLRVRLYAPPGQITGALNSWAAMNHQQSFWEHIGRDPHIGLVQAKTLVSTTPIPNLVVSELAGDPLLAIGGQLLQGLSGQQRSGLRVWFLGKDTAMQAKLRALSAYSYGTESGVENKAPNPWGMQLGFLRVVLAIGGVVAAISGGLFATGWVNPLLALVGVLAGGMIAISAVLGLYNWMQWRSVPKNILESRVNDTLFKVGFVLYGVSHPESLSILAGESHWKRLKTSEWPGIKSAAMTLPAGEIAAFITPPEAGEGGGLIDRAAILDVPAPPPTEKLLGSSLKIGVSVRQSLPVGIDPDSHGMGIGGSRTGKSSLMYDILVQMILKGDEAPGLFLVDPHLSLSDGILQYIHELPMELRDKAIQRLRIISPDQPEVLPINLLTLDEYTWAGNAIVQIGRRIWEDYWGPRMQAALLALFKLAHAWNQKSPLAKDSKMGLIHTVFAAFNSNWRHETLNLLPPVERMTGLSLDALLGQFGDQKTRWDQGWVTEVISPVLSKIMALDLSRWLFAAMHQNSFADIEGWIRDRNWIILRLPSGIIGREGARLTAGILYNIFDAAFRRATQTSGPIPYYVVIDEAQEIGVGMRLEAMLAEGAKFGIRLFVLAQSLSMLRRVEGFDAVVQALLANTSTQAFFSPDPEDAEIIRKTLNLNTRFGETTLDLKTLQCWLRARIDGAWQTPTLVQINPLKRPNPADIQQLIREVISAHTLEYANPTDWEDQAVRTLRNMLPPAHRGLLGTFMGDDQGASGQQPAHQASLDRELDGKTGREEITEETPADSKNLGW